MHIKYLFLVLIIGNFFTHAYSMHNTRQENTDYTLLQIHNWTPEDIWLQIIACCDKKWKIRETCSYFRDLASTKNEKLFLHKPLVIRYEVLNRFMLYYADFTNNDILNNLLHHRADPNSVDDNGMSVMHYITKNGNLEMVKIVLDHPDFDATTIANDDKSPLFLAAQCGHENIVDYILNRYSVNHNAMLFYAMQYDLPNFIEKLLPYATQTDIKKISRLSCECLKNYVYSNLHCAAAKGYVNVAQILIDKGAPVDLKDNHNRETPLYYAITRNSTDMIKLLIKNKADVNSTDVNRTALLHAAVSAGRMTRALFLLHHGANINAKDRYNQTALHMASKKGHFKTVQLLVAYNAAINEYDVSNKSPLAYAGHHIVELLVKQPNINLIINNARKTQLLSDIAEHGRDYPNQLMDLILQKSDITQTDSSDQSPFSYALWHKNISLIHKIIQQSSFNVNALYGPDIKERTNPPFYGKTMTALDLALLAKHHPSMQEIVDLLVQRGAKTKAELEKDELIEKI